MGVKLTEIEEGAKITLVINHNDKSLRLDATLKQIMRNDVALIAIHYPTAQKLNFKNIMTNLEFQPEGSQPIIWKGVKVVSYNNDYLLQVFSEGSKTNRRDAFRVGIGVTAKVRTTGLGVGQVLVRDVSITGFGITDRKKELHFKKGDTLSIFIDDHGYELALAGRMVRMEEHPEYNIYGFEITNVCKDLSSYISVKQREKR